MENDNLLTEKQPPVSPRTIAAAIGIVTNQLPVNLKNLQQPEKKKYADKPPLTSMQRKIVLRIQ